MSKIWLIATLTALSLLLLGSCARKAEQAGNASGDATSGSQVGVADPESAGPPTGADRETDQGTPMRLTPAGESRVAAPQPRPVDPRDSAFAGLRMQSLPAYPNDFEIGPITTWASSRESESGPDALVRGILSPTSPDFFRLTPGGQSVIDELRAKASDQSAVRIGLMAELAGNEQSLTVRVTHTAMDAGSSDSAGGFAIGEVIVTNIDGQWYISDIQVAYGQADPGTFSPGIDGSGTLW